MATTDVISASPAPASPAPPRSMHHRGQRPTRDGVEVGLPGVSGRDAQRRDGVRGADA